MSDLICSRSECDGPAVGALTFQGKTLYFCATHFQYYTTSSKTTTTTTTTTTTIITVTPTEQVADQKIQQPNS